MKTARKLMSMMLVMMMVMAIVDEVRGEEQEQQIQVYLDFAPMQDNGDIEVFVCLKNVKNSIPEGYLGLASMTFAIEFPTENFKLKKDQNDGVIYNAQEFTSSRTGYMSAIDAGSGMILFSYLDMTLGNYLINRDGILVGFVLTSLSPMSFYNSDAYIPIRFIPGQTSLMAYNRDLHETRKGLTNYQCIDAMINGYRPSVSLPNANYIGENNIEFQLDRPEIIINQSETVGAPSPVYVEDQLTFPVRAIAEVEEMTVEWNQEEQTATITKYRLHNGRERDILRTIVLDVEDNQAYVNTRRVLVGEPPLFILDGRIFVRSGLISQLFGLSYSQDQVSFGP